MRAEYTTWLRWFCWPGFICGRRCGIMPAILGGMFAAMAAGVYREQALLCKGWRHAEAQELMVRPGRGEDGVRRETGGVAQFVVAERAGGDPERCGGHSAWLLLRNEAGSRQRAAGCLVQTTGVHMERVSRATKGIVGSTWARADPSLGHGRSRNGSLSLRRAGSGSSFSSPSSPRANRFLPFVGKTARQRARARAEVRR